MTITISPSIHDSAYAAEKAEKDRDWLFERTVSVSFDSDENPLRVVKEMLMVLSPHFAYSMDGWIEELEMDGSVEVVD